MARIEQLYKLFGDSALSENITFENGGRSIIIVCDSDAKSSDEVFIFESYSEYEVLDFLEREGFLS